MTIGAVSEERLHYSTLLILVERTGCLQLQVGITAQKGHELQTRGSGGGKGMRRGVWRLLASGFRVSTFRWTGEGSSFLGGPILFGKVKTAGGSGHHLLV